MRIDVVLAFAAAVSVSLAGCAVEIEGRAQADGGQPARIDPLSEEARFLARLETFGFRPNSGDSEQEIIELGTEICRALSNGHGIDTIGSHVREQGYGDQRSGNLIGAALQMCPEHKDNLLHGGG